MTIGTIVVSRDPTAPIWLVPVMIGIIPGMSVTTIVLRILVWRRKGANT